MAREKNVNSNDIRKLFFDKEIYNNIIGKDYFIGKTYWKGSWSNKSFSLMKMPDDESSYIKLKKMIENKKDEHSGIIKYCKDTIKDIFGVNEECINKVIDAQGSEWTKIRTLHSSSLCGLLHFNKINNDNLIVFPENTFEGINKKIKFNKVDFEIQNDCVDEYPASIDVLLTNNDYILFLELKFSEYLDTDKVELSSEYVEYLNKIFNGLNFRCTLNAPLISTSYAIDGLNVKVENITLSCDGKKKYYVGGIKQMISHYIAMCNFIKNDKDKNGIIERKNRQILYAEMVFDFRPFFDGKNLDFVSSRLENFNEAYKNIKDQINLKSTLVDKGNVIFANNVLTYQDIFKNNTHLLLNKVIKAFYRYPDKEE